MECHPTFQAPRAWIGHVEDVLFGHKPIFPACGCLKPWASRHNSSGDRLCIRMRTRQFFPVPFPSPPRPPGQGLDGRRPKIENLRRAVTKMMAALRSTGPGKSCNGEPCKLASAPKLMNRRCPPEERQSACRRNICKMSMRNLALLSVLSDGAKETLRSPAWICATKPFAESYRTILSRDSLENVDAISSGGQSSWRDWLGPSGPNETKPTSSNVDSRKQSSDPAATNTERKAQCYSAASRSLEGAWPIGGP